MGPILFAGAVIALTILEQDFMRGTGWDLATAPTRDWPSGLALGPIGFLMTGTFITCGALLFVFAAGLASDARAPLGKAAGILLALAGIMLALLAFPTDPSVRAAPPTLHGRIHDAAFAALGAAVLAALLLSAINSFRAEARRIRGLISLLVAALVVPAFLLKGFLFYSFLAAVLGWCEMAATGLWSKAQ